jgi:Spy/CpxP family protein refolding chaperone
MTTRRRWLIGTAAVAGVALVGSAAAFAFGSGHGARHHLMKRFVAAAIDDALDAAKVTPEQRTRIHGVRDRTLAAVETHMTDRRGHMDAALTVFESDRVDLAAVQAMRARHEEHHRKLADTIQTALLEVHDTLTPEQRRDVADWVREHRRHHRH